MSQDTAQKFSPKDLQVVAKNNGERPVSKPSSPRLQEGLFLYKRPSESNLPTQQSKNVQPQINRRVDAFKKSEFSSLYQRPAEVNLPPQTISKEVGETRSLVQKAETRVGNTIQLPERKSSPDSSLQREQVSSPHKIMVNPRVKASWLSGEAAYVQKKAVALPQQEATAKVAEVKSVGKARETVQSPFVRTQARRIQQKAVIKPSGQETKAIVPQTKKDLEQRVSQLKEQRFTAPQAAVREVTQSYMTNLAPEAFVQGISVESITRTKTEEKTVESKASQITPERARMEIVTKLHNAAKVQHNLQSILQDRGMTEVEAKQASMQQTLRLVHQTFTEKGLLEYAVGTKTQPAQQGKAEAIPSSAYKPQTETQLQASPVSEKTATTQTRTDTAVLPLTKTELELKTELQTLVNSQVSPLTQVLAEEEMQAVGEQKTVSKEVKMVNGEYIVETETLVAERDLEADAQRIATAVQVGEDALAIAQQHGETGITAAGVATRMPTGPGERMVSFIRKQLKLSLHSEKQYNEFKTRLSERKGVLGGRGDIAQAAALATDEAPAVRLVQQLRTEKVRPIDHIRAVSDAETAFLAA